MTHKPVTPEDIDLPIQRYHDGKSPAALAGVTISGIGFILAAIAAMTGPNWTLVYISAALVFLGPIVGGIMFKMGLGNDYSKS